MTAVYQLAFLDTGVACDGLLPVTASVVVLEELHQRVVLVQDELGLLSGLVDDSLARR